MNEILFLGTGAADWDIENDGGFFRRNSAALINGELMVDCGSQIFDFAQSVNNENLYDGVTDIIITHNHSDHLNKDFLLKLAEKQKIRVGCDGEVKGIIGDHPNIEFTVFTPFKSERLGKYEIIPLMANHRTVIEGDSCAFHYVIKAPDGKKLFYGLDGAWFLTSSWREMKNHEFDVMIFDCTVGDSNDWRLFEHNTIPMLRMMIEGVKMANMLADGGTLVASHLARTLHVSHEETAKILEEIDVITAFDGMKLEF